MTPDPSPAPGRVRRAWLVTAALVVALWALAFPALRQVGVTWDEALGDLFFGVRYFSYFASGEARYLDFAGEAEPVAGLPELAASPFRSRPWEYYPVANTLGAASAALLSGQLGWLDPFDGFHAVNLVFASLLLALFVPFLARRFGIVPAAAAALLLLTAPRLASDLLANTKDFPLMVLFTAALVTGERARERGSSWGLLAAGALGGLALATKANAAFLPLVVLGVVAWERGGAAWRGRGAPLAVALAGAALVGLGLFVAVWPYLWPAPGARLLEHARYLLFRGAAMRPESGLAPLAAVAWTTPLPWLLAVALGVLPTWRAARRGAPGARLLVVWIAVVVARLHLPGAVNFDGVRHFLELFPALAAVGGIGLAWAGGRLAAAVAPRFGALARAAVVAVPLAAQGATLAAAHPFGIAWWNELAGGLGGAQARGLPQAGDYWGLSYRQGMEWLAANAEPGAALAVPIAEHAVRLVAPWRLRPDLVLLPLTSPGRPEIPPPFMTRLRELAATRPVYVMTVRRDDWDNELTRDCRARLRPEVGWTLQGGTVLSIYRYRP